MAANTTTLKTNISKLKARVLEIDREDITICAALDELYGLVERLNQLDVDGLKKREILLTQGFANRFITKQNKNKLNSDDLNNFSLLKNILMATYIVKIAYQNMVEPAYRTEAELATLSEDISNLKEQKIEYMDLLEKAEKLSNLEESIDEAENTIKKITEISDEIDDYKNIISDKADDVSITLGKVEKNHGLSSKYVTEINVNKNQIDDLLEMIEQNHTSYEKSLEAVGELILNTKERFDSQSREIEKMLEDANRASMASSFNRRKKEITKSIWFLDGCTVLFLGAIVLFLWNIFTSSYNQEIFSPTLFFSRIPITLPLIWLAWLASRKSAYLTRIKEDYAYKYSSAMAFEGYKKQVQEISPDLQEKLLDIAVSNLGENPTRLYNDKVKHTPMDLNSLVDFAKSLPKDKIDELIKLISGLKK